MLRVETFIHIMSPYALAVEGFGTRDHSEKGGFTFSVGADERDLVAAVDLRRGVLHDGDGTELFGGAFQRSEYASGCFVDPEIDLDIRPFDLDVFDAFDLIESFHGALSCRGLGGLRTKSFDEPLLLPDILLLILVGSLLEFDAHGLLGLIESVIAIVDMQLLLVQLDDLRHHAVQEILVMAHDDD